MPFRLRLAFTLMLGACVAKPAVVDDEVRPPRHACDPISESRPVPRPANLDSTVTCGNGVLEQEAVDCREVCSGGCDQPITCAVACQTKQENCDGNAMLYTCEQGGYAAGKMRCTAQCNLDYRDCRACVPGPDTRCATAALSAMEVFATSNGKAAAVFTRNDETGAIKGVRVSAFLRTEALSGLPRKTLAAGRVEGGLGFVDADRRFGFIDAETGRVTMRGPIGDDTTRILILPETAGAGVVVLANSGELRTLALFDPPGRDPADARPRHFHFDNLRLVLVPAAHPLAKGRTFVVADFLFGQVFAFHLEGTRLVKIPPVDGISFRFVYPLYTDKIQWPGGEVSVAGRTSPDMNALPPGLSRAAVSGASTVAAFGGTLLARNESEQKHTELYWVASQDVLEPTLTFVPAR